MSSSTQAESSQNALLPAIPELFNPDFLDILVPVTASGSVSHSGAQSFSSAGNERTFTENGAPAYGSTGSATLDAFCNLGAHTYGSEVGEYLAEAWAEDPDLTLRIIWNLRSIHDGKSDKEVFYRAFGWLYDNHPRTAIANLHLLVEPVCAKPKQRGGRAHGYWKDLLNILALATLDQLSDIHEPPTFLHRILPTRTRPWPRPVARRDAEEVARLRVAEQLAAKEARAARAINAHARVERKLQDPKYRALYIAVARLFSTRLLADIHLLHTSAASQELLREISLAPKWAPTPGAAHDRCTNIATAIVRLLYSENTGLQFPSALASCSSLENLEATGLLRSFYQRWILSPLRAATFVPETFMSANRWTEIRYTRVSAVCMQNNMEHFFKHDPSGFEPYLVSVEGGTRSISGATLLPHRLLARVVELAGKCETGTEGGKALAAIRLRVVEAQWKMLVQNLRDSGALENSVAICDVSGSMGSLHSFGDQHLPPLFPAIALSLLVAQLAAPPFSDSFITFSQSPALVALDRAQSLCDIVHGMARAAWGMNTDLNAVFLRLILPRAIEHRLAPERMVKRLFVFSDMQFDAAASAGYDDAWDTNYDVIERAYAAAGYEVPQIVFWNLSHWATFETLAERRGVAMMSGVSPSMLKVFMGEEAPAVVGRVEPEAKEEFTPLSMMKKALHRESYARLAVVD
ncbi:hypothetical protein FB451DRAFT_1456911 [Mycena latifolia]|nr:hypothetical protein FB451DRAFT_1456911 [Mycena latifolia]